MIYIKELFLTNFRCYKKYRIEFSPNINILIGENAVGKTSIVEAIHYLGFAKSHKASSDLEAITKKENYASIKAHFVKDVRNEQVMLSFSEKGKRIQHNNKFYNNLSDYIGYFNVVIFCPEDLDLIKGTPSGRRKFLDTNISQINSQYLTSLIRYRKFLKQRNEILKNINENTKYDQELLNIVTNGLIVEAKIIIGERRKFIDKLNPYLEVKIQAISNNKEKGFVNYFPNVEIINIDKRFKEQLNLDILSKTTTIGPHRDDFSLTINEDNALTFSSQGQQRSLSLSIKLALAELFKEKSQNLVIILDDVFSELDINRQNEILKLLDNKNQIFITTTTIDSLSKEVLNTSKIITIHKEVEEIE